MISINKKTIALAVAFIMVGIPLVTMATNMPSFSNGSNNPIFPPVTASSIASSYSNTAYVNTSTNYYDTNSVGQEATQTITFDETSGASNTINLDLSEATISTSKITYTDSFTGCVYGPTQVGLQIEIATGSTSAGAYSWGTLWANITSPAGVSYNVVDNQVNTYVSTSGNAPWIFGIGGVTVPTQSGTWDLSVTLTSDPNDNWLSTAEPGNMYTSPNVKSNTYDVDEVATGTITWSKQPTFNSQTVSMSLPTDTYQFYIYTENPQYSTDAKYNGLQEAVDYNFTGSVSGSVLH